MFFTYTSNISLTSLIIQALKIFIPISNCIVYRSDIVAFIDDSITEKLFHNKNLEFEIFLKFNNLSAGISQKFSNLSECKKYYSQAIKALEIGQRQNINPSFFEEFLINVVRKYRKEGFLKKFIFENTGDYNYLKPLNEAIDRILRENIALDK